MVPIEWLEKLNGRQLRVAVALASHANAEGGSWASMTKLTKETGIHARDLRRIMLQLVEHRLINVESRPGSTNVYRLLAVEEYDSEVPF